ncbi:MAG: M48 family metalloprotease [Syntrophorhabdaceae bacterium]
MNNIHPEMYQHPGDISGINYLKKIPLADKIVKMIYDNGLDAAQKILQTGSYFKITASSYPKLHDIFLESCKNLNIRSIPKFYLKRDELNAYATNVQDPIVTITTDVVEYLSEQEMKFVIGHELGHIQCQHIMYTEIAQNLPFILQYGGNIAKMLSQPLQLAIMRWYRKSEFSCDRAGLLNCREIKDAISAIAKISGFYPKDTQQINTDCFLEQAKDFDSSVLSTTNRFIEMLLIMNADHPWAILRAKELFSWYKKGYYEKIINNQSIPEENIDKNKYCINCGSIIENNSKFCKNCGQKTI